MFTWVISSPSNPSMPSLSIFTGFLLTEKLYWIQWGSLNEVISVTSRKFPIFMFTYWYVILTHFLTSPFSGCWGFFLFCFVILVFVFQKGTVGFNFSLQSIANYWLFYTISSMLFLWQLKFLPGEPPWIYLLYMADIRCISRHVLTQSTKVCFNLLSPEATENRTL